MSEAASDPILATTRYCAVYGRPIRHSASPAMQNAGIRRLGLDWRYLAFDVAPANLAEAIAGAGAMRFVGLNLTVPHKVLAMDLVDVKDASATEWGAVNTIRFEGRRADGDWAPLIRLGSEEIEEIRTRGFNTDAEAVTRAVREELQLQLQGTQVVLFGAGGAGRVAALKLADEGVSKLFLVNRTAAKARAIASEIAARYPSVAVECGYPAAAVDLAINATSLGLAEGDPLPFDEGSFQLSRAKAVYDMIYRPAETPLLRRAKEAGCRVANGVGMLLYQGVKALELWTELPAPVEAMRKALLENIYGRTEGGLGAPPR